MAGTRKTPRDIDDYISGFAPDVQRVLQRIRSTVRKAAPTAEEAISYQMPAFTQNGVLVYFAAFKTHIGLYPPVRGDVAIEQAVAPYAGEKGNLRFQLDEPIPYALITRIVKLRLRQNLARTAVRKRRPPKPK
jgi:uncharacterized protein YdhG (YjbR/CyaY superfamily)